MGHIPPSKHSLGEIQNRMFLPLMKIAFIGAKGVDTKTSPSGGQEILSRPSNLPPCKIYPLPSKNGICHSWKNSWTRLCNVHRYSRKGRLIHKPYLLHTYTVGTIDLFTTPAHIWKVDIRSIYTEIHPSTYICIFLREGRFIKKHKYIYEQ